MRTPAVDMPPGFDSEHGTKQVLTSRVFGKEMRFVERAVRRLVGDVTSVSFGIRSQCLRI